MKTRANFKAGVLLAAISCSLVAPPASASDYHYRVAANGVRSLLSVPALGEWVLSSKFANDTAFSITPPASDSSGAFSYSSSNPAVAEVVGDVITLKGVGTTIVTARQEATAVHLAATVTSELSVLPARLFAAYTQARNTLMLSNNSRTVAGIGSDGNWGAAFAGGFPKSTGRWYAEFYPNREASYYIGVLRGDFTDLTSPPGGGAGAGVGINNVGGASDGSGEWKLTGNGAYAAVVSMAVDLESRTVRFYRDCEYHGTVRMSTASNIATGPVKLAVALGPSNKGTIVSNFGQSEFSCKALVSSFGGSYQLGWY